MGHDVITAPQVSQASAQGQDPTGISGNVGAGAILASPHWIGRLAPGSVGGAYNALTTLTLMPGLNPPENAQGPVIGPATTCYIGVPTTNLLSFYAIYSYTGSQGNTLTGLSYVSGGGGTISAGSAYAISPSLLADYFWPAVDMVWGDSIALGFDGAPGVSDWLTDLNTIEHNQAGLPAPGHGLWQTIDWTGNGTISYTATAESSPGGGPYTLTFSSVATLVVGMAVSGAGITGYAKVTNITGTVVTITGTIGTLTLSAYQFSWTSTAGVGAFSPGPGGATPGSSPSYYTSLLATGASISDATQTFGRACLYWWAQPNGEKIAASLTGSATALAAIDTHVQTASVTVTNGSAALTVASGSFPGAAIGDVVTVYSGTGTIPASAYIVEINGNTLTLSAAATGSGTATIAYAGWRMWDTGPQLPCTAITATCSTHSVGTGTAGLAVSGVAYMNQRQGSSGVLMYGMGQGSTQTGDWVPTASYAAPTYAFLRQMVANGTPPRRIIVCMGGNDQPGFFDNANTAATMATNLTAIVQGIKAISGLIEVVLVAEYTVGSTTSGDVTVGDDAWASAWVPAIRQVAINNGCTFVDLHARFGNCSSNRNVSDAVFTAGSTSFSSAAAAFTTADNGSFVIAPGVPPGTTMSYVSSTTGTLSTNATLSGTSVQATIGGDPFGLTYDNGFHFAPSALTPSGKDSQRMLAEEFWSHLGYSRAQGAGGFNAQTTTFLQNVTIPAVIVSGLTGAVTQTRWVGGTTGGAPATGTFAVGDVAVLTTGQILVCVTAGTSGTWCQAGKSVTSYGNSGSLQSTVSVPAGTNIANVWPNATSCAITLQTATPAPLDGDLKMVRIYGASTTLSWVNTSNSAAVSAPLTNAAASTAPLSVLFQWDGQNSKWRCIGSA